MLDPLIAIAIVLVIIAGAIFVLTKRIYPQFEDSAKLTQTVLTTLAIGLAGYWYLIERKGEPHADVTQKVQAVRLSDAVAAVEVYIQVKNLGAQLLELKDADIKLQQISPPPFDAEGLLKLTDAGFFDTPGFPGEKPVAEGVFQGPELKWPRLNRYKGKLENRIEPGETDLIVATFLVSCSLETVRVASSIKRIDTHWFKQGDYAWKARTLVDVKSACTPPVTAPSNPIAQGEKA